jgi:hypothetical protein
MTKQISSPETTGLVREQRGPCRTTPKDAFKLPHVYTLVVMPSRYQQLLHTFVETGRPAEPYELALLGCHVVAYRVGIDVAPDLASVLLPRMQPTKTCSILISEGWNSIDSPTGKITRVRSIKAERFGGPK